MEKIKPKLFSVIKTYSKQQFAKDVVAGILVTIVALPLSIALALASGVTPEKGIYTAITAGFVAALLGGSRIQISGPSAAFATIVGGIVIRSGIQGLMVATLMAGVILILLGLFRLGNLIKFIPLTITTGFTSGVAITIAIGQMKDFLGLNIISEEPLIETVDKLKAIIQFIDTINWQAVIVGVLCLAVMILWPYLPGICKKIPPSLIAVFVGIGLVSGFGMKANTIGDLYELSSDLPKFNLPKFDFRLMKSVAPDAFTIAILVAIESLLSCVVSDGMIGSKHRSNMELIAQGAGNITSALFGGIPSTGAIARSATNIKNGGRTPIAGMVNAITMLLVLVIFMPYAGLIPMPTIAVILFMVAYNMLDWRKFIHLCKTSPKSDVLVLIITFALTIVFDLVVAIEVGLFMTAILFLKRMSEVTEVEEWSALDEDDDPESTFLHTIPKHTVVYEVSGALFFGAADKLLHISLEENENCLILRMGGVKALDATAMQSLEKLYEECSKKKIHIIISHINPQPLSVMQKSGFDKKIGLDNFCLHFSDAISRAQDLQ